MSSVLSDSNPDPLAPLRASPLWQAIFKLEWAHEQWSVASDIVKEYMNSSKVGIREERDENGHRYVLFAERLPKHVPILVGSGIHALRSCLDAAVSLLVEGISKKKLDRVSFPFAETEKSLRASFEASRSFCDKCGSPRDQKPRQKQIIEFLPELRDIIIEEIRPWKEGNYPLWALNKLDNFQKHRALITAFTATSASIDYYTPEGISASGCLWIIGPGQNLVIAESKSRVVITNNPRLEIKPTLPNDLPYGGEPLFDRLGTMYEATLDALIKLHGRFENHDALSHW